MSQFPELDRSLVTPKGLAILRKSHTSYSLNSLKRGYIGGRIIGMIKGDTRGVDNNSYHSSWAMFLHGSGSEDGLRMIDRCCLKLGGCFLLLPEDSFKLGRVSTS